MMLFLYSTFLVFFSMTVTAYAYVGPGPGLSMLGSFFTLVGGIFLAFFMMLLYPLRLIIKRFRAHKNPPPDSRD